MISQAELRDFLELKHDQFNRPEFIPLDPISVPHRYKNKEDIEISGLFAAILAWGRRDLIVRAANKFCDGMGQSPYDFVCNATSRHLETFEGFVYRTFQSGDARSLLLSLKAVYLQHGGLEQVLSPRPGEPDTRSAIMRFRRMMVSHSGFSQRTSKHLADPEAGSSAKRLNMFLRWMVRKDNRGVDFGLWASASPSQLICPLDVHTGTVGRKLGILQRKQNDWKAALELTEQLRLLDPKDPVKYDFSLFGLGIEEKF
jgi:uncharacterized protein (TIGR02757 family)